MTIREATEEEVLARNRLTHSTWGNRLTVEQYLEREEVLRRTTFAAGMRTWVLEERGEIVASCESYAMASFRENSPGHTEGIASVFVEPRLRGRKLAARLLTLLLAKLREEKAQASILFSEVGTRLYESAGYHARPIRARQWTPSAGDVREVATPLTREEARARLAAPIAKHPPWHRRFRIAISIAQLDWHWERARFYHRVLAPSRPPPDALCAAAAGDAWIAWMPDYRLDRVIVLDARRGTPEETAAIVEALRRAARALAFPVAEHWISPAIDLPGGTTVPRDDETPMIAPLVPDLSPEDWIDYGRGCWI